MDQQGLLEYLIATGPTVILRRTADDVTIYVSPNVEQVLGYAPEEITGVPGFWSAHVHPEDHSRFEVEAQDAFARAATELRRDYRFLHKDGTYSWLHAQTHIEYDDAGAPVALNGYAWDMTEWRAAEEQNAQLFAFPLALLFVAGLDGYFRRVSAGYERLLGWTEQELVSRPFFEFVHPDDLATLGASLQQVAAGPAEVTNQEIRVLCKDGSYRWLTGNYRPVLDQGVIYGMAVDVTERKRSEEALRESERRAERAREEAELANRAKSEFLSRMSHELRTPLNAVLGFAQLLDVDESRPQQREYIEQILRGGKHLLQLIDEVLDVAKIEQGLVTLSIEPVQLWDVVRESVDLVRNQAARANIPIRLEASPFDRTVLADRRRLIQVLVNLLSNAVKYNREGGQVLISCTPTPGGQLRIAVEDTGPGIPADRIGRLFKPFERLGAERSAVEGTGIGLSISRRLMELMGGAIGADSVLGRGSTFWVEIEPAETAQLPAEPVAEQPRQPQPVVGAERTVLYVEDNLSNLRLVEQILLRRPGTRLVAATQGGLALELARQHQPHLILLDVHLPDVEGDEVLRQLQADLATRDIPVVVVSAEATPPKIQRFLAAGARTYLTKPLDVKRFLTVVDEILAEQGE